MTPEFPRAPRRRAAEATSAVSLTEGDFSRASSRAAADRVMDILVPVSPSGTGNIFSSSTDCFWAERQADAEIIASLSRLPFITSITSLALPCGWAVPARRLRTGHTGYSDFIPSTKTLTFLTDRPVASSTVYRTLLTMLLAMADMFIP